MRNAYSRRKVSYSKGTFSQKGILPDPAKVTKIKEFTMPKDASEVRSLLGMNFCCRFIKNYATLTQPLRELTKKDVSFEWRGEQERALEKLRDALLNASENAYFDSTKKLKFSMMRVLLVLPLCLLRKSLTVTKEI